MGYLWAEPSGDYDSNKNEIGDKELDILTQEELEKIEE